MKHYVKSSSKTHVLCLLHPCHSPTAVTSLISTGEMIHIQDYPHKYRHRLHHISIKLSSLTHLTFFFWLFRNMDFKSHSIKLWGCGSPIYCSQKRKSSPPASIRAGLPSRLDSTGTVWPRTCIFKNPLQSAHTLGHFIHYLRENGPRKESCCTKTIETFRCTSASCLFPLNCLAFSLPFIKNR